MWTFFFGRNFYVVNGTPHVRELSSSPGVWECMCVCKGGRGRAMKAPPPPMSCHFLCAWWFRSRFMTSRLRLSDCKNETTDGWTSPGGIHTWNTEQWAASPLSYFSENIYESARIKGSAEAVAVCRGVKEYVCLCDLTSSPCLASLI